MHHEDRTVKLQFLGGARQVTGSQFYLEADGALTPSKLLIATSVVVIASCLYVISAFIAANIVDPNPFSMIGGVVFMPLLLALAIQQYCGTFWATPSAARVAGILLYIFSAFYAFAFVVSAGEALTEGITLMLMAPLLATMLLLAITFFIVGWINVRWARRLRTLQHIPRRQGFSFRDFIVLIIAVAAITGNILYYVLSAPPRFAEHVDRSAAPFDLPTDAADVSYYRGPRGTLLCEFTVSEASFRKWIECGIGSIESRSAGVLLQEIDDSFTIYRYYAYAKELNGPKEIKIISGLYYSWFKEDRGVNAAFDRTTGRAYYFFHSY